MKAAPFIPALLFSASAWAENFKFYAKISNKYELLGSDQDMEISERRLLVVYEEPFALLPEFNLKNGYAITGDSPSIQMFGIKKDHLAFGPENTVEPLRMELDNDMKIMNLNSHICKQLEKNFSFVTNNVMSGSEYKCNPVEIYFLSPAEAKVRMSSPENHKKEKVIDGPLTVTVIQNFNDTKKLKKRQYSGTHPFTPCDAYPTPNVMHKREHGEHAMPVPTSTVIRRAFKGGLAD